MWNGDGDKIKEGDGRYMEEMWEIGKGMGTKPASVWLWALYICIYVYIHIDIDIDI